MPDTSADLAIIAIGILGAVFTVVTHFMKTMIPLRRMAIAANIAFIVFSLANQTWILLSLHSVLILINIKRLREMHELVAKTKTAQSIEGLSLASLQPYMRIRKTADGEQIFRKGSHADHIYCVLSGQYRLVEIDKTLTIGAVIGEIGLFKPQRERSLTMICDRAGEIGQVSYSKLEELCLQNPEFGYQLLKQISAHLLADLERSKSVAH